MAGEDGVASLIPGIVVSMATFIAGTCLLLDDALDLGDFSRPDHPDPYHHWISFNSLFEIQK